MLFRSTQPNLDYRLFEAVLATRNTLRGKPGAGITNAEGLLEHVTNSVTPARLKGYALRLVPASHPTITVPLLRELLELSDPILSLEVVRTLSARKGDVQTHYWLRSPSRKPFRPICDPKQLPVSLLRPSQNIVRYCCNSRRTISLPCATNHCARCACHTSTLRRCSR